MNIYFLFIVGGLNIFTHLMLFIFNFLKTTNDNPEVFKLITYTIIFTINVLVFAGILFYQRIPTESILVAYIFLTLILFFLHFIMDEDWFFRFEKGITLIIMIAVNIVSYIAFTIFIF